MATVLVLPGASSSASTWQQLTVGHRKLSVVDYQQLQLDEYTWENICQACRQKVQEAEQPVVLVGEGLGALIALQLATTMFGRLDRLILVAPQYRFKSGLLGGLFEPSTLPGHIKRQLAKSMKNVDLSGELVHIMCETFVYCGDRDRFSHQAAEDLSMRLLDGHLQLVPKMGRKINQDGLKALEQNLR